MMRRIDREFDLPSHIARKIKKKFKEIFGSVEDLNREKEEIKRVIQGLEESKKQMQEYLEKLETGEIPSIEDRLTALEKQHEIIDHQTLKDSLNTIGDAILQLNKKLNDLDSRLKTLEEKLASQA